jgi:hypothetical protein
LLVDVALQILSQAPTMDFPLAAAATSSPNFSVDHTKIIELETVSPNVSIIDNLHFLHFNISLGCKV